MAKIRLGCLALRIETGRYQIPRLPEDQRICLVCPDNLVEDETHFLFSCSLYSDLRHSWVNKLCLENDFNTLTETEKLCCVFNDTSNIKATATYISNAWERRNKYLN